MFYIFIINIIAILIMLIDKQKAIHNRYRIAEKYLFIIALLGGSIGILIGMYLFHHKTKHWYFVYGIPSVLIIQIILFAMYYRAVLQA